MVTALNRSVSLGERVADEGLMVISYPGKGMMVVDGPVVVVKSGGVLCGIVLGEVESS